MSKPLDPFNADECNSDKGQELRKSISLEDCQLCKPAEDMEQVNDFLSETMEFITNSLPKKT